jgi:hypothetical protein
MSCCVWRSCMQYLSIVFIVVYVVGLPIFFVKLVTDGVKRVSVVTSDSRLRSLFLFQQEGLALILRVLPQQVDRQYLPQERVIMDYVKSLREECALIKNRADLDKEAKKYAITVGRCHCFVIVVVSSGICMLQDANQGEERRNQHAYYEQAQLVREHCGAG